MVEFSDFLLKWWDKNDEVKTKRMFPWRRLILGHYLDLNFKFDRNFMIILAEVLLHRTNASIVNNNYMRLTEKYKSFNDIVDANEIELKEELKPLGNHNQKYQTIYYISKNIVDNFDNDVPIESENIRSLFKSFKRKQHLYLAEAFDLYINEAHTIPVDTNIERIFVRVFNIKRDFKKKQVQYDLEFCNSVKDYLPEQNVIEFNMALLDLGALICKKRNPKCEICPVSSFCTYFYSLSEGDENI